MAEVKRSRSSAFARSLAVTPLLCNELQFHPAASEYTLFYQTTALAQSASLSQQLLDFFSRLLRRCFTMNYTKSESPTPDVEEEEPPIVPFPLLDLPLELVLHILRCLDERSSATEASFPSGPPTELLHLAATSTFFYQQCRPRIWRSIRFEAQLGGMRPEAWVQRRSLRELVRIMQGSKVVEGASRFAARQGEDRALERGEGRISQATRSQDRPFAPLPIKAFSYSTPRHIPSGLEEDDIRMELEALLEVIWSLKHSKVQVLFLYAGDDLPMPKKLGAALMTAVLDLDALSALRMNQMYFSGKLEGIDQAKPMPQLRTLQIMHGSAKLVSYALFFRLPPSHTPRRS